MKNKDAWVPGKFVFRNNRLVASSDTNEVGAASRLAVNCVASFYDQYLPQYARGRLADLGCGKVPLFEAYRKHITDNVCVDWENSLHENIYLDQHCDLTKPLPFEDQSFDTIILSDVLEHIPEPELLWRELARLLAKDGHLFLNVPFYYWLHEQPHDFYRYTSHALKRFVNSCGLKMVVLAPIGGAPEILADVFSKNILMVPLVGRMLARLTQYLTSLFLRTRFGARVSRATADEFPLGYFLIATKEAH